MRDLKGLPVPAIPTKVDLATMQLVAHPEGGGVVEFRQRLSRMTCS